MSNQKFAHSLSKHLVADLKWLTEEDLTWQKMKPIPNLDHAYRQMSILYVKYILLTNSFTKLINMTVTYHKRERLKPVLSNLHGRILELKSEMTKMRKNDIVYLDNLLMEMSITRRDIELLIPDYYRMERSMVVKEFYRFAEKIKDGLVLKQFPKKPVPEIALDLRKYYLADMGRKRIIEGEQKGRKIEKKFVEDAQKALNKARGLPERLSSPIKRPPHFSVYGGRGEIRRVVQMMGFKRDKVYEAMRLIMKQPLTEPYESWKFPFARDVVRAPYFQGNEYFHGYDKLVNVFEYGKFVAAISLLQKHERARTGAIRFMIMKERHEKIFTILMNRRKGLKTVLKSKEDFKYPIVFRDHKQVQRKSLASLSLRTKKVNELVRALGLVPLPGDTGFCERYHQYKHHMRKMIQHAYEEVIEAEIRGEEELAKYSNFKELDIIDEILEYFRVWHQASKAMTAKYGWDLLDIPSPEKKTLPPPNYVAGIPKVLTDQYVKQNFDEITNIPQRGPPIGGTALIVTGNHISPEQYMACKPLALGRQNMSKEQREAEAKKLKDQKEKQKEKKEAKRGKEEEGYKPQKSQIPLFVMERAHDLEMAHVFEETDVRAMVTPEVVHEEQMYWKTATKYHLHLREGVDKKMIAVQKDARVKTTKKHRKAENLKKRNPPGMKKPKKEWALGEHEKWDIIHALAKEGYFRNYRNKVMDNMPGTNHFAYANYEWIETYLTEPEPAWGDLYQLAKLWCILPLADMSVRQYGPLVSAVGFVGPRDVVNRLVCAVAHESGAVLIHIDPMRPEGDIPVNQLANMITKIAKSSQPTIILVDNCHLVYRKKEKGVSLEPSPYTKAIAKIKKGINRKFKVLLIGASDKPELINGGKMSKVFDRVIAFPHKDYHAAADYWGRYLFENEPLELSFPYAALVEPTKTYKTPELTEMFSQITMTPKRKKLLPLTPLKIEEFIEPLMKAKATDKTSNSIATPSAYAWANGAYKSFKARKKYLKTLLDERNEKLNDPDKKKKKK